mmetsp:Transcript_17131/g.48153  ORF Transcript_17131/g.48153 Transcript_17131/m.48153 type:complete len:146 (+) Transcript_17131:246-683(+)
MKHIWDQLESYNTSTRTEIASNTVGCNKDDDDTNSVSSHRLQPSKEMNELLKHFQVPNNANATTTKVRIKRSLLSRTPSNRRLQLSSLRHSLQISDHSANTVKTRPRMIKALSESSLHKRSVMFSDSTTATKDDAIGDKVVAKKC